VLFGDARPIPPRDGRPNGWKVKGASLQNSSDARSPTDGGAPVETAEKPEIPRQYINHANIYATPFDVVLEVGVKGPPRDETKTTGLLVMSPQMAKVLAQLLSVSVQQWEAKHGEIKLTGQLMHAPSGGAQGQIS